MPRERLYFTITYGCQMNENDSEKINGQLKAMGYSYAKKIEDADILILNTCCVREKAEEKLIGKLGEIKRLKKKKPGLTLGIGGCMMQQAGMGKKMLQKYPFIDFVFGPHTIDRIPMLLQKSNSKQILALEEDRFDIPMLPVDRSSKFRAWIPIIKGCNNFCSYCIVPYVRGREVSRLQQEIITEIERLVAEGTKEIVLLGQNVNAYGHDRGELNAFAKLLQNINAIKGLDRIRFITSHPRDFNKELVTVVKELEKTCEHFHLPLQAGSDRILAAMNRGYTQSGYLELTDYIHKEVPEASITTDIIVGFPGETETDFNETLKVVEEVEFDAAFMFLYSPRKGTKACELKDPVPVDDKKNRLYKLMQIQNEISCKNNLMLVGSTVAVLSEGPSKKNKELTMGRTRTNKPVIFDGIIKPGELAKVKLEDADSHTLFGHVTTRN